MLAITFKSVCPFYRNHPTIAYLDNAATTHKPQIVIDAIARFYACNNAPVHRGVYSLAENATIMYEKARSTVARFIGAYDDEVIFTKGTTEGINFIASAWAEKMLKEGDEIILTELEHHSNILPWLHLEKTKGIVIKYIPIFDDGTLDYEQYKTMLTDKTKLVSCTAISNVLGTVVDLDTIISNAHQHGAKVCIDAAQAVGRMSIDVHALKVDFLAFSAHKMYGPMGTGVLYISRDAQKEVEPYQYGGGMVYSVDWHEAQWAKAPLKFEAGTPSVANVLGLAEAVSFINRYFNYLNYEDLKQDHARLCEYIIKALQKIPSIRILGPIEQLTKSGHMVSFVSDRYHPHDIAAYLDKKGICVRAGNHCAQPLHKRLGIASSVRVSLAAYNDYDDILALTQALTTLFQ